MVDRGWVQSADITLTSGRKSSFKIECDDLTDDEIATMCGLLAKILPPFGSVTGVPTGGIRLESAMRPYVTSGLHLVVDDVWTTGGSIRRHINSLPIEAGNVGSIAVLFARGSYPAGVTALFTLDSRLWAE